MAARLELQVPPSLRDDIEQLGDCSGEPAMRNAQIRTETGPKLRFPNRLSNILWNHNTRKISPVAHDEVPNSPSHLGPLCNEICNGRMDKILSCNDYLRLQGVRMVLQERIELSTSPLPRECSTTELLQRNRALSFGEGAFATWVTARQGAALDPEFRHKWAAGPGIRNQPFGDACRLPARLPGSRSRTPARRGQGVLIIVI